MTEWAMRRAPFVIALLMAPVAAWAQSCPAPLASARRLVLAVAPAMSSTVVTVRRYERSSPAKPWREIGGPASALIGRRGVAWGPAFRAFAQGDESVKIDGDERAPAGFYRIGPSFGFLPSRLRGYMRIAAGTVCVDDPASPAYNTITTRAKVGWRVHGENMWRASAYRRGLLVDYPTDRRHRAGSCIFIHVWRPGRRSGTAGCIALAERQVAALQRFAQGGAVLAVLLRRALGRFKGCLP